MDWFGLLVAHTSGFTKQVHSLHHQLEKVKLNEYSGSKRLNLYSIVHWVHCPTLQE